MQEGTVVRSSDVDDTLTTSISTASSLYEPSTNKETISSSDMQSFAKSDNAQSSEKRKEINYLDWESL